MSDIFQNSRRTRLPAKVLLSLSNEMYDQLRREAVELQSTVSGVARQRIAQSLARDGKHRAAETRERAA